MFEPVLPQYDHQRGAVAKAGGRAAFAYLMAMRTGKSKVTIDEWGGMRDAGELSDFLVTAPAGAYHGWEKELKKHLPPDVYESLAVATWESGSARARREVSDLIRLRDPGRPRALIVNVEAHSSVDEAVAACSEFLSARRAMYAVDESTTIKNPTSVRTRAACTIGPLAPVRRILTGRPTPRSPLDLFSQFWFLDPKILGAADYAAYEKRYAIKKRISVGGRYIWVVVGYQNVEELYGLIEPHSFRVRLEDCYDVPKKVYLFREVDLTPEQARMYADLKERATTKLASGEHVTATEVVTQMLRLHQLCCGHLVDEDGSTHSVPSNRVEDLLDIIEEYDQKAIIWCSYARDVLAVSEALRERYGKRAVACFWGGNKETREEDSHRFENDRWCASMVATPGAGGRGRTWDAANLMIYYSNTDNLEHRDQSEERGSAVGKTSPVTVIDMIARGTVEEKIVTSLRAKITMASEITGDDYQEWLI